MRHRDILLGVSATPGGVEADRVVGFENQAEVDRGALDIVVLGLVLAVVTFVFQL